MSDSRSKQCCRKPGSETISWKAILGNMKRPERVRRQIVPKKLRTRVDLRSGLEVAPSAAKRRPSFQDASPYRSRSMRVKLFSLAVTTPIQSLEDDINECLESQRPHVTYVSLSSSDIDR